MRTKILAAALAGAVWTGLTAVPVQAQEGHASCKAYGQTVSEHAQTTRPWGQVVSDGAQLGFSRALVAEAHTVEGLCQAKP